MTSLIRLKVDLRNFLKICPSSVSDALNIFYIFKHITFTRFKLSQQFFIFWNEKPKFHRVTLQIDVMVSLQDVSLEDHLFLFNKSIRQLSNFRYAILLKRTTSMLYRSFKKSCHADLCPLIIHLPSNVTEVLLPVMCLRK